MADVVDEAKHLNRNIMTMWKSDKLNLQPISDTRKRFFVRIQGDADAMKAHLESRFGPVEIIKAEGLAEEFGFVTEVMAEGEYEKYAAEFPSIVHMIRVEG